MALTAADIQALVSAIVQPMLTQMMQIVTEARQTEEKKGRIDHRSIGGPPEWDSTMEESLQEWHIKLQAWLMNQDSRALK